MKHKTKLTNKAGIKAELSQCIKSKDKLSLHIVYLYLRVRKTS